MVKLINCFNRKLTLIDFFFTSVEINFPRMENVERGFAAFAIIFKVLGFTTIDLRTKNVIVKVFPYFYLLLVAIFFLYVTICDFRELIYLTRDLTAEYSSNVFSVIMFGVGIAIYDLTIIVIYANFRLQTQNHFMDILKSLTQFDAVAKFIGIDIDYKKLCNRSILLLSPSILVYSFLMILFAISSLTIAQAFYSLLSFPFYYVLVLKLKFYLFILYNVYVRLDKLNSKIVTKKLSEEYVQLIFSLLTNLFDILNHANDGFGLSLAVIISKFMLCLFNLLNLIFMLLIMNAINSKVLLTNYNYFQVQILFATTSHIFVLIIMEGLEDDVHATHLICRFSGFKLFNDLNN